MRLAAAKERAKGCRPFIEAMPKSRPKIPSCINSLLAFPKDVDKAGILLALLDFPAKRSGNLI